MISRRQKGKVFRVIIAFLLLTALIFFTGRYLLYTKIKKTIESELSSLSQQGIFITYDNLDVDPWEGGLEVYNLVVKVRKDSLAKNVSDHGLQATLPFVEVRGVQILPFLKNKTLAMERIHSNETNVTYCLKSTLFKHFKQREKKVELKNISVAQIDLPKIDIYLTELVSADTVAHVLTDVDMSDLFLANQLDSLVWQKGLVNVANFAMNYKKEDYGVSVRKIQLDISEKEIHLDSLLMKPVISRSAFMKVKARQVEYMEIFVPFLDIRQINWYTYPSTTLQMDRVDLSLSTIMFRDKRLPFVPGKERSLPSHFLQRLPLLLQIDTLKLKDSFISYEEMPAQGDSTGLVYFENLNSTVFDIHNNPALKIDSKMHATARFMGVGKIDVHFTFPYDTMQRYHVAGTLRDMPLDRVNKMLGSAAQAKVESGIMRNLKFNFSYTAVKSKGSVELNYENLKVLTLRENKRNEQSVSVVKTLLLNAFILRRNMNENVNDEKRQGEIDYYRDVNRSVVNYWWKSILDGIKSAYNLDKLPIKAGQSAQGKETEPKKKRKSLKTVFSRIFKGD